MISPALFDYFEAVLEHGVRFCFQFGIAYLSFIQPQLMSCTNVSEANGMLSRNTFIIVSSNCNTVSVYLFVRGDSNRSIVLLLFTTQICCSY